MTSPDSNDDTTSSKYDLRMGERKGIGVGGNPLMDLMIAEATYRQNVVDVYKRLSFSGFDTSDWSLANVPLEEVFVRLTLTVEKVIRDPISPISASRTQQEERVITVQEPIGLDQVLGNHLLIVGEPGAGKSTLLRWLAVTFAQGCQRELSRIGPSADADRLPVLVELGRLPDRYLRPEGGEAPNWLQFLPEYLTTQMTFTNTPPQLLTQALADGRCLLLFDGLDEVVNRQVRARIARSLVELALHLPPGNRMIIDSRPAGVSQSEGALRPYFQRCQIERFTPDDVRRFFHFWYALDHSLNAEEQRAAADALYARVQATPAALRLATTPLLSTILVLIWRNEGDLPARRVDLYERCCRLLIEHWEASHDVAYQGVLTNMDWEDHLHLLTPLAYFIHNEEQRTSTTREELVPRLAQALQAEGRYNEQGAATRAAKQFLDTLGLRSGLLQYLGNDQYGFPHLTFQEYLAARYIAAQPDPDYIDLVMAHLHEAWWQEVHLLTIGHLGSGKIGVNKASALILTILKVYSPPSRIWRPSRKWWVRMFGPARLLPQVQLARRIDWLLAREFELVAKASMECKLDELTAQARTAISIKAASLVRQIASDWYPYQEQKDLLAFAIQLSRPQSNETVVRTLLRDLQRQKEDRFYFDENIAWHAINNLSQMSISSEATLNALLQALNSFTSVLWAGAVIGLADLGVDNKELARISLYALHHENPGVRTAATRILERVGVGNGVVVSTLLQDLHKQDPDIRKQAVTILGQVGGGSEAVVDALLQALHDKDANVRRQAALSLGQIAVSNEVVLNTLLQALHDENANVRRQAAKSLGLLGISSKVVVDALLQALHDENANVREQAAESLGQIAVGNEVILNTLLQALYDEDASIRRQALTVLGAVGTGNRGVLNTLLQALHDEDSSVRRQAAKSLGQVGGGSEAVVDALLQALHDRHPLAHVREQATESLGKVAVSSEVVVSALLANLRDDSLLCRKAIESLGRLEIKGPIQLYQVLVALNRHVYDFNGDERLSALRSISQLLDGQPIPGYRWVPLRQRRTQKRRLKRIVFWLSITAFIVLIGLVVTWLLGVLNPNGFPVRFLAVLAGIIAFIAAIAQVLGRTLRDPWDHS